VSAAADTAGGPVLDELLLVGCGKMGGALLRGWRAGGVARRYLVVEPGTGAAEFAGAPDVAVSPAVDRLEAGLRPSVVVFAVKPQAMGEVVGAYRRFVGPDTVFLSIAAGKTIGYFARHLGSDAAIVRAMPNTPAAIGRGITVACANPAVARPQIEACGRLLAAAGEVAWIEDEALMDAVTAVSGSGPAYVFFLIECLAGAGIKAGLPPELALRLARATVAGAGELALRSDEAPEVLRRNVTSPGGTTQAALGVLMPEGAMPALFDAAIAAATRRSRELAE
jgi:pyrroline-5-carboxylate reductase